MRDNVLCFEMYSEIFEPILSSQGSLINVARSLTRGMPNSVCSLSQSCVGDFISILLIILLTLCDRECSMRKNSVNDFACPRASSTSDRPSRGAACFSARISSTSISSASSRISGIEDLFRHFDTGLAVGVFPLTDIQKLVLYRHLTSVSDSRHNSTDNNTSTSNDHSLEQVHSIRSTSTLLPSVSSSNPR